VSAGSPAKPSSVCARAGAKAPATKANTRETAMCFVTSTPHRNSSTFSVDVNVPNWCDSVETTLHRHRNTIAKFQKHEGLQCPIGCCTPLT
jgi:hypothetical protein